MRSNLRIGLFGGSFDPVHFGHLELAQAAKDEYKLDKIVFIPAKYPPHKLNKKLLPAAKRLRLLSAALKPFQSFKISRFELKKKSTTYTYQTAAYFRELYPNAELFFIIGGDSLAEIKTWKNIARLAREVKFIVGRRKGARIPSPLPYKNSVLSLKYNIKGVSSTEIRRLAARKARLKGLVPGPVENTIIKNGWYSI